MQKNIIISLFISVLVLGGAIYYVTNNTEKKDPENSTSTKTGLSNNITIVDGIQYITVSSKSGYTPKISTAQANTPTKLIIKTNGTVDCSASLVIKQLSFHKILPPTGEETIDIGMFQPGEKLQGVCSMGMYSFQIKFE